MRAKRMMQGEPRAAMFELEAMFRRYAAGKKMVAKPAAVVYDAAAVDRYLELNGVKCG